MFFGALALTTFSYVGCKDYDDDIDRLEQKITENANAIAEINKLIEGGSVITKVENITGGVEVTLSNGKSFTIKNGDAGKDGTQWTIKDDGYWYQDGKKTEFKAKGDKGDPGEPGTPGTPGEPGQPGTPGDPGEDGDTYIPGEDGFWYKNEVKPENKTEMTWIIPGVVSVADMGDYYIFSNLKNTDGTVTSATIYKYSATFVSSLVHVTSNINKDLGDVVFLPVIAYDGNSTGKKPVYEYNSSEQVLDRTLVNGWAEYEYKLNPANVNPKYFTGLGFIEQTATTRTASDEEVDPVEIGLPIAKIAVNEKGKLVVKATAGNNTDNLNAFKMFKSEKEHHRYDNPDGKPMAESSKYGETGKVNMLAYQVKNTNEAEELINGGIVVSDYVATKRMVVEQGEASIAVAVNTDGFADPEVMAPALVGLSQLYKIADVADEDGKEDATKVDAYIKDNEKVPVTMQLMYTESLDLNTIMKGIATTFHTNTHFKADESQYLLTDLGFENITFSYTLMSYEKAEVDQTKRYIKLDGSTISVIDKQHAAIHREPVVKVAMSVDGKLVMTKLLKIKIDEKVQLTKDFTNTDLTEQTLGCAAIYGGGDKLAVVPFKNADPAYDNLVSGLKIDFDQYFNALEVSKDKFVEYYDGTPEVAITFAAQGGTAAEFTDFVVDPENVSTAKQNLIIDYSNITGHATSKNNYVYFGLKNQLHAGTYVIKFTYSTKNTAPKYKSFTITTTLVVKDPVHTWEYNPSTWKDKEYMIGYGQPTKLEYDAPFLMKATLEDGFMETWDGCGEWDFEIADKTIEAEDMKLETEYEDLGGGKYKPTHVLQIFKKEWLGKKIRIRAVEYIGDPKVNKETTRKIDNYVSTGTTPAPKEFDIMFVNPVAYAAVKADWYLVDKMNTTLLDKGAYLPIYRLFKLYDVKRGEENGMMFNGGAKEPWAKISTVESGKSLFKMHKVVVSYALSDKNTAYVKEHASILLDKNDKEIGLLKWNNDKGVAVGDTPQPIIIDVTIKNTWDGKPSQTSEQKQEITVYVKKADTKYTMPATGFWGTSLADLKGLGSYEDVEYEKKEENK